MVVRDRVKGRAVDQAMAIGDAGLPTGGVAGTQHRLAAVLVQDHLAFEDVDELVFVGVPVPLGRLRSRLEPRKVDTELVEPDRIAEPLARASLDRFAERIGIAGRRFDLHAGDFDLGHSLASHLLGVATPLPLWGGGGGGGRSGDNNNDPHPG